MMNLAAISLVTPALPALQAESPLERLVNGLVVLILLLLVSLCLVGFMIVLATLLPGATARSKAALLRSPWRAFLIGLANYLFIGGISLVLLSTEIEPLVLVGLLLAAFLVSITVIGLGGLAVLVGERLAQLSQQESSRLKQLIQGTLVIELAGLLPLLGWFVLAPILLMVCFGAAVLGWRNRREYLE